jgi:hypothetical protein
MDNIPIQQSLYQSQINKFSITRLVKNKELTNDIWEQIKIDTVSYIITKYKSKKFNFIINKINKIIGVYFYDLILKVVFYTAPLTQDSPEDNILIILNINKEEEHIVTSLDDINPNFYNIIQINESILDISIAA